MQECNGVSGGLEVAESCIFRHDIQREEKGCSVHVHVSLPCTGGSPLLNFCTTQVREQHTADFKELL